LGWNLHAALTSLVSGPVEWESGDPAAAEAELRRDYETLRGMGEQNYIATTAACLAESLYRQDALDEADRLCAASEAISAPDDMSSQPFWRSVRGKILARRGRFSEAEALVREALTIIDRSDDPNQQGNTLMDLAEVLRLAGRHQEAGAAIEQATELFRQKGNVAAVEQALAAAPLTDPVRIPRRRP